MSLVVRSPLGRAGLVAGSLAAIAAAALTSRAIVLVVAVLLLLPIATSLSQAGRLAVSIRGLRRRPVSAVVWGVPIRSRTASGLRVESVRLLKVAQPRSWRVEDGRVVIDDAAYVQWAGKRLARVEGHPAVAVTTLASGVA